MKNAHTPTFRSLKEVWATYTSTTHLLASTVLKPSWPDQMANAIVRAEAPVVAAEEDVNVTSPGPARAAQLLMVMV